MCLHKRLETVKCCIFRFTKSIWFLFCRCNLPTKIFDSWQPMTWWQNCRRTASNSMMIQNVKLLKCCWNYLKTKTVKFRIWLLNGRFLFLSEIVFKLCFFLSLGPLVNKVKEYQVETIVEALCANMISEKEQLRDISSIGLKTVIAELPQAPGGLSGNICKRITGRLTTAIERVRGFCSHFLLCQHCDCFAHAIILG